MGSTFLHYDIKKKIGEGGMGVVYLARDTRLNRDVALKFLPKRISKDQTKHRQFRIEAQAAAGLNHRNIAQVYAIEEDNGEMCIVLEYVDGNELKTLIDEQNLSTKEKTKISIDIAEGIKAAHNKGIIHRDIKSRNIMIDSSNGVKIMDFGLARLEGSDHSSSRETTAGTTSYMSPEQLQGAEADARSDIWSFGVVLYEMFTGELPFKGMHEAAIMYSITEEEPPSLDSADIPGYVKEVINRCLKKKPEDRYQNMSQLLGDLKQKRQYEPAVLKKETVSKHKTASLVIGAAVISILLSLFFFYKNNTFDVLSNVPDKKYLAVLPITNIGDNPEMQDICDGLAETLSFRLSELEQYEDSYWVTPASEIRKENVASAAQANKIFGVNLAISSSIQTFQDSTRLILELIDADNIRRLGTEQVVVSSNDLAQLEEEGVKAMLTMLRIDLQPKMAQTIREGSPGDPEAYEYYLKGRANLQHATDMENLENAIQNFERALELDPDFALAHAGLGESYWRQYELTQNIDFVDMAKSSLNEAQALNDELPHVQYLIGLIENGTGNYDQAIYHFKRTLDLDPKYTKAYTEMAQAHSNLGEQQQAVSTYKRVIELKPDYWLGYRTLAEHYLNQGNFDLAIENFQKVVEITPNSSAAYSNLGVAYHSKGSLEEARRLYERSLALEEHPFTASNLASFYFSDGLYEEAAEMYKIALEEYTSRYDLWGNYAVATEWAGDTTKARELYRTAIEKAEEQLEVNPEAPILLANLASFNSDLNNRDEALRYIEKALSINSEPYDVRLRAVSTYENLGMREKALEWISAEMIPDLEKQPEFRSLTEDPEYLQLKSKLQNQ